MRNLNSRVFAAWATRTARPQRVLSSALRWQGTQATATAAAAAGTVTPPKKQRLVKRLISQYGLPFAIYYIVFNDSMILLITVALQMGWVGAGDVITLIKKVGAEKYLNGLDERMDRPAFSLGPLHVTGRLVANFALAFAFMGVWTPIKIPFCIATLPYVKRAWQAVFRRSVPRAAEFVKK